MKTTIRSLTLSLLALAMQGAGFKSFSKSCMAIDGQFYGVDKVGFYCFTKNVAQFEYMYSLIDLRHCVANNVGSLVGYEDGDYHKSCDDCKLESVKDSEGTQIGTCYLSCDCYDMEGQRHRTKFDLSDVLENDDGRLVCFGHRGTRDRVPPGCHHNPKCDKGKPRLSP